MDKKPVDACFVIVTDSVNALTVVRKDGSIGFPGGKVEEGEGYCDAASRELREEVGFGTTFDESHHLGQWFHPVDGRKLNYFILEVDKLGFAHILGLAAETVYLGDELSGVSFASLKSVAENIDSRLKPTMDLAVKHYLSHLELMGIVG